MIVATLPRSILSALIVGVAGMALGAPAAADGLTVVEAVPGKAAAVAGLAVGQQIDAWQRRGADAQVVATGPLENLFDLWQVEVEERPRGGVRLRVDGSWVELPTTDWGLAAWRPALDLPTQCGIDAPAIPSPARIAAAAQQALASGDEAGAECFMRRAALGATERLPALDRAHLRDRLAAFLLDRDRFQEAFDQHDKALQLRRAAAPSSLAVASSLDQLGIAAWYLGDRDRVRASWHEALAIRQREVPDSLLVAKSLNNLSLVVAEDERMDLLRRALVIRQRLDPDGALTANLLSNLSTALRRDGDNAAAETTLRQAEQILRRVDPEARQLGVVRMALGEIAKRRGRLAEAEVHLRDAASHFERVAPRSFDLADAWLQLGDLLLTRWDSERADVYLRRALDLFEQIAPESPKVVPLLLNLGLAAKHRGDTDAARAHYEVAVERGSRGDADGMRDINVAIATHNLGSLAESLGQLDVAARRYGDALDRFADLDDAGADLARTWTNLGLLRLRRGDSKAAERALNEALAIQERLAPGTIEQARALAGLAQIALQRGDVVVAEQRFRRAVDALDADRFLTAGGDLARSRALEDSAPVVHAYAAFLVEQGRVDEAFALAESLRGRSFRALLARRDVRLRPAPAALDAERRRLQAAYDRTLLALGSQPADGTASDGLRAELDDLRERLVALTSDLAVVAPLAGFGHVGPEAIATVRSALPAGTVALSYLIGAEHGLLFVVTNAEVRALAIPVGSEALARRVDELRRAIERRETLDRPRYRRAAEWLAAHLLDPVAPALVDADAVVVIPDGPLHRLPFAALPDPADSRRYWVEATPSTIAPSLVALSELASRSRLSIQSRNRQAIRLAAFGVGDPRRRSAGGTVDTALGAVRGTVRAGLDLEPLAHVDREVAAVAGLFADRARTFLDADATEEAVKGLEPEIGVVHFATHAWVDDRFPLESGLVLSLPEVIEPGLDNGVLQAWEIVEQLRLDADLVTLSGCRTGLGRAFSGEGMLGLTRAFHLAGARAVLASLWQVGDASTSTLMTHFYGHLHRGLALGDALRAAQLDLVGSGPGGGSDLARPYHWAGFQLFGYGSSAWTTTP